MARLQVHLAVPDSKRAIAATMTHLSGLVTEHSIRLTAIPGSPSAEWNAANGQGLVWWGASQGLEDWVASDMMTSAFEKGTQSWFAALWTQDGQLVQHNLPQPPDNPSFAAFLQAAGLDIQASIP